MDMTTMVGGGGQDDAPAVLLMLLTLVAVMNDRTTPVEPLSVVFAKFPVT